MGRVRRSLFEVSTKAKINGEPCFGGSVVQQGNSFVDGSSVYLRRPTYLDESGCCCDDTDYGYGKRAEHKRISQRRRRGRRINIFGVWLPLHCFDYALMVRTLLRSYFCAVNELASPEGVSALPSDRTGHCIRVGQRFGASRSTN